MTDLIGVVLRVVAALDSCRISYTVGGSLASSFSGEPRASIDADILVSMAESQVPCLIHALGDEFYAESHSLGRAVHDRTNANVIHRPSSTKVDLFIARTELDAQQLARRRRVQVASEPDQFIFMHSAEDILLQKLHWFRLGGEVSERQWRDVVSIVRVQGARLDRSYVWTMATGAGLTDLVERAYRGAGE